MNDNMLSEKDTKAVLGILVEQLGVPEERDLFELLAELLGGPARQAAQA